jgi:hypothetical protein
MATDKNKKEVKVRDLKPSKDAKGGAGLRPGADGKTGPRADSRKPGLGADHKTGPVADSKKFGF